MKLLYLLFVVAVATEAYAATNECAYNARCPANVDSEVYLAHEEDVHLFYRCTSGVGCLMDCRDGGADLVFNEKEQYCELADTINPTPALVSKCPVTGRSRIPHESNCNAYYDCYQGEQSKIQKCGEGLVFNPVIQMCDLPFNVNCPLNPPATM